MTPSPLLLSQCQAALPDLRGPWIALTGGRVNRLWRCGETIIKAFQPGAATALFPNDCAAEVRALQTFAPHALAPTLQAAGDGWLAYRWIPGQSWRSGVAEVARMLGALHQTQLPDHLFVSMDTSGAALEASALGQLRAVGLSLMRPLASPEFGEVAKAPLHGDPVPGNIIVGNDHLWLIDWQCPAFGDPAHDLAIFLSPAMQSLYRGIPLTEAEVDAFLSHYPDEAVCQRYLDARPWLHLRIAAHCAVRAGQGASGYAAATRTELLGLKRMGVAVVEEGQTKVPIQTPAARRMSADSNSPR